MRTNPEKQFPSNTVSDGIFISYKRRDSAALAGRLHDYLSGCFPGQVFMDVVGIAPGRDFRKRLSDVMCKCRVVVALIGPNWESEVRAVLANPLTADYYVAELEQAIAANLVVIPLLIDGTTMPSSQGFPASIQELQFHQALEIRTTCFIRDIAPLQVSICQECGFAPPTLWEQLLNRIPGLSTSNEPTRDSMAIASMISAMIGIMGVWLRHAGSPQSFVMFTVACFLGMVGINSRRWRRLAYLSLLFSAAGIIFMLWALTV